MIFNFELMNNAIAYFSAKNIRSEIEKAKEIRAQIKESIDWLSYMITRTDNSSEYDELQKEIKSATRQYYSINKKIESAELSSI